MRLFATNAELFRGDLDLVKVSLKPYADENGNMTDNKCIIDLNENWILGKTFSGDVVLHGEWDSFEEDGSRGQLTLGISQRYSRCNSSLKTLKMLSYVESPVTDEDEKQFRLMKGTTAFSNHFMAVHVTSEGKYF